jgi:hypothetical protein
VSKRLLKERAAMCKQGTTTCVPTPDWFWDQRTFPENGIAIDSCIVGDILTAWKHGVYTGGSCCGHYREPHSVVLLEEAHLQKAQELLPGFKLYLWKLVDVGDPFENAVAALDNVTNTFHNRIFNLDMIKLMHARETMRKLQEEGEILADYVESFRVH